MPRVSWYARMPVVRTKRRTPLSRSSRNLLKPPPQSASVCGLHVLEGRRGQRAAGDEHDVGGNLRSRQIQSIRFPQKSLRPVALDGAAHLPARDHCDPQPPIHRRVSESHEKRIHQPSPLAVHELEVTLSPKTLDADTGRRHTLRRRRPFRRRRANTARPPFDRIRTRNPCVRLRRLRFGWNVLFMTPLSQE
jgi:hypothetical protein